MNTNITIDELLSELSKIETPDGKGMTTDEISKSTNIGPNIVRKLLHKGIEEGLISVCSERRTTRLRPGWHFNANVFRVVEQNKGESNGTFIRQAEGRKPEEGLRAVKEG